MAPSAFRPDELKGRPARALAPEAAHLARYSQCMYNPRCYKVTTYDDWTEHVIFTLLFPTDPD